MCLILEIILCSTETGIMYRKFSENWEAEEFSPMWYFPIVTWARSSSFQEENKWPSSSIIQRNHKVLIPILYIYDIYIIKLYVKGPANQFRHSVVLKPQWGKLSLFVMWTSSRRDLKPLVPPSRPKMIWQKFGLVFKPRVCPETLTSLLLVWRDSTCAWDRDRQAAGAVGLKHVLKAKCWHPFQVSLTEGNEDWTVLF